MSLAIILVKPQLGENIGAAARVMKNFDLTDLRIVAPRDGWPNPAAESMAAGAKDMLGAAGLYDTTAAAIADCHRIYATSSRLRYMEKPLFDMAEAMQQLVEAVAGGQRIGVMFGPERSGLDNEDLALADAMVTIPVGEAYPSLNLAQAVAITCYEWTRVSGRLTIAAPETATRASKQEMQSLFDDLEARLDDRNFWKVEEKKPIMWRNIRNMFQRQELSEQEVRTLRGIIQCLCER